MDLFFALLRNALWHSREEMPDKLSEETAVRLLWMAKEQTVQGLLIDVLIRNNIQLPREQVFKILGTVQQIQQTNQKLNEELKCFVTLPLEDYVVVKGQTVAAFYPNPMLRMSGDIDFLVRDYAKAKGVLQKEWNIELPERLIDKEYSFEHGGVTYEIHTSLMAFSSRSHRRCWERLMRRPIGTVEVDATQVPTLEPTAYAVYVFVHLFFHFIREGVGLRQMCDWAMLLHHYREVLDCEELERMLHGLGIEKAYRAFGCILVDKLGLQYFPLALNEQDRRWSKMILQDIMQGGNFGRNARKKRKSGWQYKTETFRLTLRNCRRYFRLAPVEMIMIVPRVSWLNVKLLLNMK